MASKSSDSVLGREGRASSGAGLCSWFIVDIPTPLCRLTESGKRRFHPEFVLAGRGSRFHGRCRAAAFAGLGWFHLEGVVEAVEVVEQANGAQQFHDLTFGVEASQLGKLLVADCMGVAGDGLGQAQGGLFCGSEVVALRPISET